MKKKLWGLVAILLFIFGIGIVHAVTTDTEPPTVSRMTIVDPKDSYKPGERVYLNTDLKDDVSGFYSGYLSTVRVVDAYDVSGTVEMTNTSPMIFQDDKGYYFEIPETYRSGLYYVEYIDLTDTKDNRMWYYTKDYINYQKSFYNAMLNGEVAFGTNANSFEEYLAGRVSGLSPVNTDISLKFYVDSGKDKDEIPVLDAYSLDKEEVKVGEPITIDLKITDDSNQIAIWVRLSNGATITTYAYDTSSPVKLTYTPNKKEPSGELRITSVILQDNYDNLAYYYTAEDIEDLHAQVSKSTYYYDYSDYKQELNNVLSFNVINDGDYDDEEPPVLKNVKINKTEVPAPSIIKIEVEATDNKALGEEAVVVFKHSEKEYVARLHLDGNKYVGELDIDQYAELGEYELVQVFIGDAIGNDRFYFKGENKYKTDDLELNVKFNVTSKFTPDVVTSTSAEDLVDIIKNAKDGSTIAIDATRDSRVKKEVFEAIKGTDKTIYIEAYGIEWVFNGKDITEPKDIITTLGIYYDYDYQDDNLNNLLEKALVLQFADNGQLPGIATVRIKLDYNFRDYVGDRVFVFHYVDGDPNKRVFSEITGESVGQNENGWFEFKILHNSTYVLSTSKPEEKYIEENKELVELNKQFTGVETGKKINKGLVIAGCVVCLIALVIIVALVLRKKDKKATSK